MLANLNYNSERNLIHYDREAILDFWMKTLDKDTYDAYRQAKVGDVLKKLDDGVYLYYDVNAPTHELINQELVGNEMVPKVVAEKIFDDYSYLDLEEMSISYPYGVCDNYQQVLDRLENINYYLNSDEKFCIILSRIKKSNQPSKGGWRWHKWGEYIGDHKITTEYLYDEPNIDEVYVFNIYRIKEN